MVINVSACVVTCVRFCGSRGSWELYDTLRLVLIFISDVIWFIVRKLLILVRREFVSCYRIVLDYRV